MDLSTAFIKDEQKYFYHKDRLNNVVAISDETGNIVERYDYGAYGELTVIASEAPTLLSPRQRWEREGQARQSSNELTRSSIGNPITYTGQRYDSESGLYYYKNRYYSSTLGRFLTKDPLSMIDGPNLYAYVNNDPINWVDPMGTFKLPGFGDILPDIDVGGDDDPVPNPEPKATIPDPTANTDIGGQSAKDCKKQNLNPSRSDIENELESLSNKHNIPKKALIALISTESDFRQFDKNGDPLSPKTTTAVGLGQILKPTAKLYGADYEKLSTDWKYNLEISVKIYAAGYNHAWNSSIKDEKLRAARAYGMYHDGFLPVYKNNSGYLETAWEKRFLANYD